MTAPDTGPREVESERELILLDWHMSDGELVAESNDRHYATVWSSGRWATWDSYGDEIECGAKESVFEAIAAATEAVRVSAPVLEPADEGEAVAEPETWWLIEGKRSLEKGVTVPPDAMAYATYPELLLDDKDGLTVRRYDPTEERLVTPVWIGRKCVPSRTGPPHVAEEGTGAGEPTARDVLRELRQYLNSFSFASDSPAMDRTNVLVWVKRYESQIAPTSETGGADG